MIYLRAVGLIHGTMTIKEVLQHGNFGLGTLSMLDGECIVLDGVVYQQRADGSSVLVPASASTPYMMVTFFDENQAIKYSDIRKKDWSGLKEALSELLPSENTFAAVKIRARFSFLKLRAVRKQEKDRPLVEVTKEQAVFEFREEEEGFLIGFWSPEYLGHAVSVPGFHLHFITNEFTRGGHVLDLMFEEGTIWIQPVYSTIQETPKTGEFAKANLIDKGDDKQQLAAAES